MSSDFFSISSVAVYNLEIRKKRKINAKSKQTNKFCKKEKKIVQDSKPDKGRVKDMEKNCEGLQQIFTDASEKGRDIKDKVKELTKKIKEITSTRVKAVQSKLEKVQAEVEKVKKEITR